MRRVVLGFAIALVVVLQDATAVGADFIPAQSGCGAGLPFGPEHLTNTSTFRLGNASCETAYAYWVDAWGNKQFLGPLHAGTSAHYQATPPAKVCVTFSQAEYVAGAGGACFSGPEPFFVDGHWGSSPIESYIFNRMVDALYKARARIDAAEKKLGRRILPVGEKSAVLGHRD